ncbi:MAG: hypothetical protein MZV65_39395 [Chromatiales bacterium]|nr:hypothetical protein [Chromatiales bacterium]
MSAASNFLESALLEHFRGTQLPLPSNFFVALHTADPTDAATPETEVATASWPAYARQTVGTPPSSAWTASADEAGGGKQITNANTINFPANNGTGSVQVTHFSIWDASTGGNMWAHAPLTAAEDDRPDRHLQRDPRLAASDRSLSLTHAAQRRRVQCSGGQRLAPCACLRRWCSRRGVRPC